MDEPDGETTEVAGGGKPTTKRMGDLAEADARKRLADQGFDEQYVIENASGHGTDVVAIDNGPPPRVKVIEVKSGSSGLNKGQEQGGVYHFGTVIDRARGNKAFSGQGVWQKLDDFADDGLTVNNYDYEIWKYDKFNPDNPSSIGTPTKTDWTPGTKAGEFQLDTNGEPLWGPSGKRRLTTPRVYTTVE